MSEEKKDQPEYDPSDKILNVPDDTIHEWSNPMDAIRYGLDSYRPRIKKKKKREPNKSLTGW